jgi:hypothetical protein
MASSVRRAGIEPPPPGTAGVVTLARVGQYVRVLPCIGGLDRLFYTGHFAAADFVDPAPGVLRLAEPLIWEFGDVEGTRYSAAFAGLEALLGECLERAGFRIGLKGQRPAPLPPPGLEHLDGLAPHDAAMLEFVRHHERGLIRYAPSEVRPARLIAQIARAYPGLRIAVAATRNADARAVARELARHGVDTRAGLVLVGTYLDLLVRKKDLPRQHALFALNPAELFDAFLHAGVEVVRRLDRARLFGLVGDDLRLAPRLRDHLTTLFGVEQVYVPKHGYRPVPVEAVFVPLCGGNRLPNHRDDHVVKRLGVHAHPLRNRRVARLARALAEKDHALLWERFPEVAALGEERIRGRVGVLVDTVDHGLTLAGNLGWPLVAGAAVNEQGLSAAQQALLQARRDRRRRTRKPAVVTAAGLAHAGRFDVLVRADAGTGLPPVPAAKLRTRSGRGRRLLLIDFLDRHHPLLRKWSRQRQQAYRDASWGIACEPPQAALDRFLATRPEVLR